MDTRRTPEEELAAFLDGRLAGDERRRVLERAVDDPDHYALLAGASATLAELETEGEASEPGGVDDDDRETGGSGEGGADVRRFPVRRWGVIGLAAAAALAALLVVPWADGDPDAHGLLTLASSVPARELPGGSGGLATAPWQSFRGVGGVGDEADDARIIRAGARLADLAAATAAADAAAGETIARDLAVALEGVVGGGPVAARLRDAASAAASGTAQWTGTAETASAAVVQVFDSRPLRLGIWLETVRLAALTGDAELLGSRRLRSAGRSLAQESPQPAATRIRQVVEALETPATVQEPDALFRLLDPFLGDG